MDKVYIVLWVYKYYHDERKYIEAVFKSENDAKRYIKEEMERGSSSKYEIEEWEVESLTKVEPISLIDYGSTLESIHKDAVALEFDEKLIDELIEQLRRRKK